MDKILASLDRFQQLSWFVVGNDTYFQASATAAFPSQPCESPCLPKSPHGSTCPRSPCPRLSPCGCSAAKVPFPRSQEYQKPEIQKRRQRTAPEVLKPQVQQTALSEDRYTFKTPQKQGMRGGEERGEAWSPESLAPSATGQCASFSCTSPAGRADAVECPQAEVAKE